MSTLKLPRAIVRKNEELERFEQEITQQNKGNENIEDDVVEQPEDVLEVQPTPPKPDKSERSPEETAKYWEHRFRTLEGIHNAENTKQQKRVKELEEATRTLTAQISKIEKSVPREYDIRKYLSEEELDMVDERQIKASLRVLAGANQEDLESMVSTHIQPLKEQLDAAHKAAEQAKADAIVNSFWNTLDASVENWEALNADPKFLEWLAVEDGVSGYTRHQILSAARDDYDASRVVSVFKRYIKDSTDDTKRKKLERRVAPNGVPASNDFSDGDAPVISADAVKKFYSDVTKGRYRNNPKAVEQMERRIEAAYKANTIT